jgi:hypothetical protein
MHEFEYRAPKPVKTKFQWFKIIALRVIFLPILLWDLLSILVNALIGRYIAVSYFHLQGTSENWDYMQERTGFAPLSESPEDIRDAILETKEMGKTGYDWSSYNFDVTISDGLCKTTASAQPNLKQHLIFLRLFEGTKNFALFDAAQLADGSYNSNLPPANVIKFSHTSAQITRDALVDNIVENIENLLENGVDPASICLGKTTQRLANAIINLVQERLAKKNISIKTVDINKWDEDTLALEDNFCFESHRVITYDQNELETFEIQPSSQRNLPITEQKYLIGFPVAIDGGEFIDNGKALDRMVERANRFQCNVVGFHFRGNGKGKGQATSIEDCIVDGIAQVQRALDKGVAPKKILLEGYCFGGAVATAVVEYFHNHGIKIGLFNDRSFSNATNMLLGRMRVGYTSPTEYAVESKSGYTETLLEKCKAFLAMPFVKLGLLLSKWEIEAAEAYQSLPDDCKEYMVVKSSKQIRQNVKPIDDAVITDYASLHEAVKYTKPLFASLNETEKLKSKARKMQPNSDSYQKEGHSLSRKLLHIRKDETQTADDFYVDFVNRYFSR